MKKSFFAAVLACLVLGFGCASPGVYFADRGLDFVDCFKVSGGIGLGLDVHARVTDYYSIGFGFADTLNGGFCGRTLEVANHFHAGVIGYDVYVKSRLVGTGGAERTNNTFVSVLGFVLFDYDSIFKNATIADRFDIEVSATLVYLNARVGFRMGQFADFLLGWFGVDIGCDDTPTAIAAPPITRTPEPADKPESDPKSESATPSASEEKTEPEPAPLQ